MGRRTESTIQLKDGITGQIKTQEKRRKILISRVTCLLIRQVIRHISPIIKKELVFKNETSPIY